MVLNQPRKMNCCAASNIRVPVPHSSQLCVSGATHSPTPTLEPLRREPGVKLPIRREGGTGSDLGDWPVRLKDEHPVRI